MLISDWSSDVCSSDLRADVNCLAVLHRIGQRGQSVAFLREPDTGGHIEIARKAVSTAQIDRLRAKRFEGPLRTPSLALAFESYARPEAVRLVHAGTRSEERRVGKEWVSTCRSRWSTTN